jgi:acylphosphatase
VDDIEKKTRAHVLIKGKVQGVYFRQNTKQVATKHNVNGWVRNLLDGRVEAIFEGDNIDVNKVIEWCHIGPPNSMVDDVEVRFEKYTDEFASFTIKNN